MTHALDDRRLWIALAIALATLAVSLIAQGPSGIASLIETADAKEAKAERGKSKFRDVLAVSNNWDGTMDFVDPHTFEVIKRISIIPDEDERIAEILADPVALGYFSAIRIAVGEGNNQYVDDAFTSNNGKLVFVSRPSFKDVVAIHVGTGEIRWRFVVDGYRSDHMAISPDGKTVLVSASTGNVVHAIDARTGEQVGVFETGDSPHENNYIKDGDLIVHASIGLVYTPLDQPAVDSTKGERFFDIVDAHTFERLRRINMGEKLEEAGYPQMSAAVRPMTLSPNERFVYFQVSFFHGYVEYDLRKDKVIDVVRLPLTDESETIPREMYLLDSAHHGIAMNARGTKLCVAGTMSDYAAIVNRRTTKYKLIHGISKPYWSTQSADGKYCFVSASGNDEVIVISYRTGKQVATIPVGDHPQRMRTGRLRRSVLG